MSENGKEDREQDWLLRQRDEGLTHGAIAELIGVDRSTVTNNLTRIDDGRCITNPHRRKIAAHLDRQEREDDERRRAEDAVRRRHEERIQEKKREAGRKRLDKLKRNLKALEAARLRELREVNARLEDEGIDTGGRVHGDGVIYARTLEKFHYADPDLELVGFVPDGHRFPCGCTGAEIRKGFSAKQRQDSSLAPAGSERPEFIGVRRANLVKVFPCPDELMFLYEYVDLIDKWRWLFQERPSWSIERELPSPPTDADVDWYRQVLEIETELLSKGLCFEQSIIDQGDDWRVSADSARAVLDDLERRVRRRKKLERLGRGTARLFPVALLAAVIIAPILLWDVFVGDAVRSIGDFLLVAIKVVLTPFVLLFKGIVWLLDGIGSIIGSISRAGIKSYDGIVWFLTFPWLSSGFAAVIAIVFLLLAGAPSGSWRRHSPTYPWFMVIGIASAILAFATIFYWFFNAPLPGS